jgi:hypothetical protein
MLRVLLPASVLLALGGCQGAVAIWGNLAALLLSIGIFCGTLLVGRK